MSKPQQKPQPKPLPLQKPSRQEAVPLPRDVPQIRPFTPDRQMPDLGRKTYEPVYREMPNPSKQMPEQPPQQTPEQRNAMLALQRANAMLAYQQANYPIGLGGYLGQGPQFGGSDPRLMPIPSRPSTEPMISPETIKKARDEYLASLPKDRAYSQVMTKTKYGGEFGSSIGSGFDKWFEQNYINNPKSSLTEQERMSLQGRMKIPEFGDMGSQIRAEINARNGSAAGPQFGLGQIPDAGFYNDPNAKIGSMAGPQFGGPKLGYLGSETQLGMGSQFGGIASGMQDFTSSGQQDEMRKKMMESLLAYNKQSQGNMMGGFGQPIM